MTSNGELENRPPKRGTTPFSALHHVVVALAGKSRGSDKSLVSPGTRPIDAPGNEKGSRKRGGSTHGEERGADRAALVCAQLFGQQKTYPGAQRSTRANDESENRQRKTDSLHKHPHDLDAPEPRSSSAYRRLSTSSRMFASDSIDSICVRAFSIRSSGRVN